MDPKPFRRKYEYLWVDHIKDLDPLPERLTTNQVEVEKNGRPLIIYFQQIMELRERAREILIDIIKYKPDYITFFATGGIPLNYFLSEKMLKQCPNQWHNDLFHRFPGLAWGDDRCESLFKNFLIDRIVKAHKNGKKEMKFITIDTTYKGNGISGIRKAVNKALVESFKLLKHSSLKVDYLIIAVVDYTKNNCKKEKKDINEKITINGYDIKIPGKVLKPLEKQNWSLKAKLNCVESLISEDINDLVGMNLLKREFKIPATEMNKGLAFLYDKNSLKISKQNRILSKRKSAEIFASLLRLSESIFKELKHETKKKFIKKRKHK